ncbi:MAG: ComEC/Rec2 family competence protein [Paludibacter sp.]
MDFLQRTPFFRLLLPFVVGVIFYQYVELLQWSLFAMFGLSILFILASFFVRSPKRQFQFRWLFGCGIFLLMLSLAYFRTDEQSKATVFDRLNKKEIYRVELIAPPIEKAKSYQCKVDVLEYYEDTWKPTRGQVILYFQKDKEASQLLFGDRLLVEAEFSEPERAMNPDGFDYAAYLKRQGIGATCYISSESWKFTGRNETFSIRREADKWRNYLLSVYREFDIRGDEFAVLAALTLGYTDDLQPDLRASYSATGAMHILSVSGMHVGVVYVVMAFLLGFMDKSKRLKIFKGLFIMLFLWTYAFLTGMSAAVIRAALMFSFVSLASCFERKPQIYNSIFASAFGMLLYNPNFLFDVGFQLSYSAVLSILFFQPVVNKFYTPTNRASKAIWGLFAVSLAAQLGTAPFVLYYFQQFPNYFILTNFIAIPLSTVVIYLAIGLLATSFVPYLSIWVAFLLKWMLWTLNFMIVFIQNLPFSVSHVSFDISQTIVIFLAIFCLSAYYFNRRYEPLFIGIGSILLACVFNLYVNYNTLTSKRMIVYAGQKNTHISFINRNQNLVFTTDSVEALKIGKTFWQNQKLEKPRYVNGAACNSDGFLSFEGKRLLVLTTEFLKMKSAGKPLDLDYLVVGSHMKPKIEQILDCIYPRNIIVDKNVSKWYVNDIRQACNARGIGFYSVAEQGAYVLNIKD